MSKIYTPMTNVLSADFPNNSLSAGAWLWSSSILLNLKSNFEYPQFFSSSHAEGGINFLQPEGKINTVLCLDINFVHFAFGGKNENKTNEFEIRRFQFDQR